MNIGILPNVDQRLLHRRSRRSAREPATSQSSRSARQHHARGSASGLEFALGAGISIPAGPIRIVPKLDLGVGVVQLRQSRQRREHDDMQHRSAIADAHVRVLRPRRASTASTSARSPSPSERRLATRARAARPSPRGGRTGTTRYKELQVDDKGVPAGCQAQRHASCLVFRVLRRAPAPGDVRTSPVAPRHHVPPLREEAPRAARRRAAPAARSRSRDAAARDDPAAALQRGDRRRRACSSTSRSIDYPRDTLEIQVLDDSTDESRQMARSKVAARDDPPRSPRDARRLGRRARHRLHPSRRPHRLQGRRARRGPQASPRASSSRSSTPTSSRSRDFLRALVAALRRRRRRSAWCRRAGAT